VVYNGDIRTREDWLRLKARFPGVTRWMVGRGAAADPFLFGALKGEARPEVARHHDAVRPEAVRHRDPARLKGFLDDYLAASLEELYGPASVLGRMKELWSYLHQSFVQGERLWKAVRVCRTVEEYRRVAESALVR
jgi:tRNA-dihydrouridine synthase